MDAVFWSIIFVLTLEGLAAVRRQWAQRDLLEYPAQEEAKRVNED